MPKMSDSRPRDEVTTDKDAILDTKGTTRRRLFYGMAGTMVSLFSRGNASASTPAPIVFSSIKDLKSASVAIKTATLVKDGQRAEYCVTSADESSNPLAIASDTPGSYWVPLGADVIGFRQAGDEAIQHSIESRMQKVFLATDHGAVGDGRDEHKKITSTLRELDAQDGGILIFPMTATGGVFGLSETLLIPENVTVSFQGGCVKILETTTYDAALIGVPGAQNIRVENPQIDCNNIPGACGIIMRKDNPQFVVVGGVIRNCAHDKIRKGGRAINIEAGVNPVTYGARNAVVLGTVARDCYEAISVSGGSPNQQESNIRVDMVAENCESAISGFGNAGSYPHSPRDMGGHITMTARNCGKAQTYDRAHGVINCDRAANLKIDIQVMNDADYGAVGSLFRGDASNVVLNAQMTGDISRAICDFASYQEADAIDEDATWTASNDKLSSLDSLFTVKHTGTCADLFNLPIFADNFLTNCQFYLYTDAIRTLKPINAHMANKSTCWVFVQNKKSNAIVSGYASNIGAALTFADVENLTWNADPGSLKARLVFQGSTAAILDSFNIAGLKKNGPGDFSVSLTVPAPNDHYTVHVSATPTSTSTSQNDFVVGKIRENFQIGTFSGGVAQDKDTIEVSVFW